MDRESLDDAGAMLFTIAFVVVGILLLVASGVGN